MKVINGDIRTVTEGYILQQANCTTSKAFGLSASLREAFPGTCPYDYRKPEFKGSLMCKPEDRENPGGGRILGDENVKVISLYGQYFPGGPSDRKTHTGEVDDEMSRRKFFSMALDGIVDFFEGTENVVKIAVPYMIGCGLAKGNWDFYSKEIERFEAELVARGVNVEMTMYKLCS